MRRLVVVAALLQVVGCRPRPGPRPPTPVPHAAADAAGDAALPSTSSATHAAADPGPWGSPPPERWGSGGGADVVDPDDDDPKWVVLGQRRAVWMQPSGPAWGSSEPTPWEGPAPAYREVPDPHGLRVAVQTDRLRLLVYASPDDLATLITRTTPLFAGARSPTPPANERIELLAGAPVEIAERRRDWTQVRHRWREATIEGWVPSETIGTRFEAPLGEAHRPGKRIFLGPGAEIRGRRSAAALLVLPSVDDSTWAASVLGRDGGLRRVTFAPGCTPGFEAFGFVRPSHIRKKARAASGPPCAGPPRERWADKEALARVTIAAGVRLLERPGGRVVGIALDAIEGAGGPDGSVWIPTPWGPIPVALATSETP